MRSANNAFASEFDSPGAAGTAVHHEMTLTTEQITIMLDRLSTDDVYRKLFVDNLSAALAQLPGRPTIPPGVAPGCCLMPRKLADKSVIGRTKQHLIERLMKSDNHIPKILEW